MWNSDFLAAFAQICNLPKLDGVKNDLHYLTAQNEIKEKIKASFFKIL